MNYSGNRYTDYNKQTVVVGIFYTVLAKSWKERNLPEREDRSQSKRIQKTAE
jgi:hypothetical protein